MTHWTRPRGLTSDQRATTATRLRAIADQLDADHAGAVQANLAAWADPTPWPSSTGAAGSGTGPSSPVEHAVGIQRADTRPISATPLGTPQAMRLLAALHQLHRLARLVDDGLHDVSPARTIAVYPCGHPVDRDYTRCQVVEDGVQCGAGATTPPKAERRCATCDAPMPSGKWLDNGECGTCARFRRRKGRARIATSRLALDQGLLTGDGTYHAEGAGNGTPVV